MSNASPSKLAASDGDLRKNLEGADLPALLATVAYLTRDPSVLKAEWRPTLDYGVAVSALGKEDEKAVRRFCFERLVTFRNSGQAVPAAPTYDDIQRVGVWIMGAMIESALPLALEEMVDGDHDMRKPRWSTRRIAPARKFSVGIIGAGESGLLTGFRLQQADVDYEIYEKNKDVGGTWYENHYPGCRVDCNSFFYSYAFGRNVWSDYYGHAKDLAAYFSDIATRCGLREHIRFSTEVTEARWLESEKLWEITVSGPGGKSVHRHDVLISAVGQLNRPLYPDIDGRESFAGPNFHSARWDHSADLKGKSVAVIGTGASAAQFIPQVAREAGHVTIMARTVPWLLPTTLLHEPVSSEQAWLLENLPSYAMWYRATLVLPGAVGMLDGVVVDPDFPPTEKAVSALNEAARKAITDWLEAQIADRPDLRPLVIPTSPLGGKRIIRDNGTWVKTLKRENVSVVTTPIERITRTGIRFKDGTDRKFDALVYGTGFQASRFLFPMKVIGRKGNDLRKEWDDDDARAYLGMTVPGFPNLFILYGPNTNQVVHGGSAIMWTEFTVKYVLDAVRKLLETGAPAMDVKREVYDEFTKRIDDANRLRAWGFSKVNSWYKNSKGRATQNYPFSSAELWQRTHEVAYSDYHFDDPVDAADSELAPAKTAARA